MKLLCSDLQNATEDENQEEGIENKRQGKARQGKAR